jgi:hypothetical protein|tara:strand:+ start:158 stop:334 length:177 start_codon:yes stop_codon:yes gene_type:complete
MLDKLNQEQFEHILDVLILYNSLTPKTTQVFLNERSIKDAFNFMSKSGSKMADNLGIN